MEKLNKLGNIEYEEDRAIMSLNPKIYPLEIIYSASYIMIDSAFILLDGNPKEKILVEVIKKKPEQDIKQLVEEFNQELLNYAVYKQQSEKNKRLNEIFLEKILLANNPQQLIEKYNELKNKYENESNKTE